MFKKKRGPDLNLILNELKVKIKDLSPTIEQRESFDGRRP